MTGVVTGQQENGFMFQTMECFPTEWYLLPI
jgi:hypothetical protein